MRLYIYFISFFFEFETYILKLLNCSKIIIFQCHENMIHIGYIISLPFENTPPQWVEGQRSWLLLNIFKLEEPANRPSPLLNERKL